MESWKERLSLALRIRGFGFVFASRQVPGADSWVKRNHESVNKRWRLNGETTFDAFTLQ